MMFVPSKIMAKIKASAAATDDEICGLLFFNESGAMGWNECKNHADDQRHSFFISPVDFASVEDDLGEVAAVVHSHGPDSCEPSEADIAGCDATEVPWLVVGGGDSAWIYPKTGRPALTGRVFEHGVSDCWSIVRDWYLSNKSVELPNPPRADGWWRDGGDMYRDLLPSYGFYRVGISDLRRGDVILMAIRSNVPNHAAVFIGGGLIVHHLQGRLSEITRYGGPWESMTDSVYRFKENK